ncbi:hypothetical protein HY030_01410 [Candidatus Gottesmanbacteria bacterium]|nr:hypothetical protein [Candidatus Gottesmanbacteria bacterium]
MPDQFKVSFSEIVGTPKIDAWTQVFVVDPGNFKSAEKNKLIDKGRLFYLISLKGNTEEEIMPKGKELATKLEAEYYQDDKKPFLALKSAVEKTAAQSLEKGLEIEIAACVLQDNVLYLASLNQAHLFLYRQSKLYDVIPSDTNLTLSSGLVINDDLILLCSTSFLSLVNKESILANLDHHSPLDITSAMAPLVLGSPLNANCSFLIINFKKQRIEENEIPEEEVGPEETQKPKDKSLPLINFAPLFSYFKSLSLFPRRTGFSHPISSKRGKTAMSVALILTILLLTSVVWGIHKKEEEKARAKFNQSYDEAKNKFDEGSAIINLNNTQARNFLINARDLLQKEITGIKNKKSEEYQRSEKLLQEISNGLTAIGGVYKIDSPEIFYDLNLLKDKAGGVYLSLYKKTLLILDLNNSSVYKLALASKAPEIIAGGDNIKDVKFITLGPTAYLFSPSQGILEVSDDKKVTNVVKADKDWGEIAGMVTFSSNLYLLDKTKGDIIKYVPIANGFSDARSYLARDIKPDFSKATGLVVDGFVWVISSDGSLVKFGQGKPVNFAVSGLDTQLSHPIRLFSSDETKNIYLLDRGNKRVVVLNKEGVYQAQYQWEGIKDVTDLVALEDEKKMFLLSGNKIYVINLK